MSTTMLASASDAPTLENIASFERVDPIGDRHVSRFAPGVLVKYGQDCDAEVRALQFIHGRLSVRTPRVLKHAPFTNLVVHPWRWTEGVWYFTMEECPGVLLYNVIDGMSPTELDHIADQLRVILDEMRSYTSTTLGAVTGGPYNNRNMPYPWTPEQAFSSIKEYLDYYREIFGEFCAEEYVDKLFSVFPTEGPVYLTHGDLLPHNILVEGSRIRAIIDWETAGYYPEFWEYCRMHDPVWTLQTPAWKSVLARVFPGPRREKEINAVYKIVGYLRHNNPYVG